MAGHGYCERQEMNILLKKVWSFRSLFFIDLFGHFDDPVVPTLRGSSGDVVTAYAY